MSIINSLLDTDLYKFTMGQVVFHQFSSSIVEYKFKLRNKGIDLTPYKEEIENEIAEFCKLKFTEKELNYLRNIDFLSKDYIEFLSLLKLSKKFITVTNDNGELNINIRGPWFITIYFEVPVLAIVNEVYFNHIKHKHNKDYIPQIAYDNLKNKIELLSTNTDQSFKFADFGTRRRFSKKWQDVAIKSLINFQQRGNLLGTSNVMFAMKYNIKPVGTMAHEFIQACQTFVRLKDSQKFAFQSWANEFKGDLGIVLSDTVGFDVFLNDFDLYFSKLFDGVRQDSGDPFVVGSKLIEHYNKLGIDPKTKTLVFSDGLTFPLAIELHNKFSNRIKTSFGIGTNLMNDCGFEPLQIVIKMTKCNGQDVAKLSNTKGKEMCENKEYMNYLRSVFDVK